MVRARRRTRVRILSWIGPVGLLISVLAAVGVAQTSAVQGSADVTSQDAVVPLPSIAVPTMQPDQTPPEVPDTYTIGTDDLLSVFVFQMPELSSEVRVNAVGDIRLPFATSAIPVLGLTSSEVARKIEKVLRTEQLAVDPVVRVVVREVESRPIVVAGAVKQPLVVQATRPMTLLEVLARAGGPLDTAGQDVLLTRTTSAGRVTETINLPDLIRSRDPGTDPVLTGGEVIRVLPARMIYVTGDLQRPGAFPLQGTNPVTVLGAIALAEGINSGEPADKAHSFILRTSKDGQRTDIPINLDRILQHRAPDPELQAGDILYVPEDGRHKVMTSALNDLGQALVLSIGYNLKVF